MAETAGNQPLAGLRNIMSGASPFWSVTLRAFLYNPGTQIFNFIFTFHAVTTRAFITSSSTFASMAYKSLRGRVSYPGISGLGGFTDLLHPVQQVFVCVSCYIQWPSCDGSHADREDKHAVVLSLWADGCGSGMSRKTRIRPQPASRPSQTWSIRELELKISP